MFMQCPAFSGGNKSMAKNDIKMMDEKKEKDCFMEKVTEIKRIN